MKYSFYTVLFFSLLLSLSFVAAAPPFQEFESTSGLYLRGPSIEIVEIGADYRIHVHVINISNAAKMINDTTTCFYHLYNQTGWDTSYAELEFEDYNGVDFAYTIDGGNWSVEGDYSLVVQCEETATGMQGLHVFDFSATRTGQLVEPVNTIIVFSLMCLAFIFLTLSFFFKDEYWILKSFFQFLSVLAGLIGVNSARIISSESDTLGTMGTAGLLLLVVCVALFFLWIFVRAFKEIIKIFKEKGNLRWE